MNISIIIACEIGFWVLVGAGLISRYLLRLRNLGAFFLIMTPVVDLILLIVTLVDLKNGASASFTHGLAAVYLGVSVVYGHSMINWADKKFASWAGQVSVKKEPPKYGKEHAGHERKMWYRHLLAWGTGSAIITAMVLYVGDADRTKKHSLKPVKNGLSFFLLISCGALAIPSGHAKGGYS